MTNFNERTNTLLYKNIPLTLYSRKSWCWLCVRGELEMGNDSYIVPKVLLTIAALLPHLAWGCSAVGHWLPQAPSLQADSHAGILSPNCLQLQLELTQAVCGTVWLYNCLRPPASAVPPLIYTGASLDWQLGRGSIYNIYPAHRIQLVAPSASCSSFFQFSCLVLLFTPLEFLTSVLGYGFSLEFEWQQVSSSLQDSSQDSGRS